MDTISTDQVDESRFSGLAFDIDKAMHKITTPLMYFSMLMAFLMMLLITYDVFMRSAFNKPLEGGLEFYELMMVLVCFAAFPFTQNQDAQIGIDMLQSKLSEAGRALCGVLTNAITTIFMGILTWQMGVTAIKFYTRNDIMGISGVMLWPFMLFATISIGFLTFLLVLSTFKEFAKVKYFEKSSMGILMFILAIALSVFPFFMAGTSLGISKVALGGLGFVYLIFLALLGMPVAYSMLVTGVQLLVLIMPTVSRAMILLGPSPFYATAAVLMTVIPLFVMMGEFALYGNISTSLFRSFRIWTGATPGGLAISSVGGCAGFAAVCGDAWVTALTMASVSMPAMEEAKYDKAFGAACLSIGGPLGILIPPSYGFIIYSIVTDVSVGRLFIAGIFPGLLLTLFLCIIIYIKVKLNPSIAPIGQSYSLKEKIFAIKGVIPMMCLFGIIVGGILTGTFTPNEGGAVASFACLAYTVYLGTMNPQRLMSALKKTCNITSMSFMIFIGVGVLGYALAASRFPNALSDFIIGLGLSKYGVLLAVIIMFTILGCMMSATPMLLLALPAIFPTIMASGFDPVWFGVICVIMMELSAVTPPVGLVVYALSTVIKDVPVARIFYHLTPMYLGIFALLILLVLFPDIALYLPNKLFN